MKGKMKVGIALGSGAARGIAHIGVLQVLKENNIPIDMIAGSSMGSVIGALYCCGMDPFMMEKIIIHLDEKNYYDFTVPKKGFMKGNKVESLIQILTRNKNFNELEIPLAIVASDLNSCQPVVFTEGKIYKAIRASISIPGVFVPVEWEEKILVDGGLAERVPVCTLKNMGADLLIAVDVGFRGVHEKATSILEVILQSLEFMEWEVAKQKLTDADIMITPELLHINPATFTQAEECIQLGRTAALRAVPDIRRVIDEWDDDSCVYDTKVQ